MAVKMSINISDDARKFLTDCVKERGGNITTHVHRAISVLRFIYDAEKDGDEVQVKHPDGTVEKITFIW